MNAQLRSIALASAATLFFAAAPRLASAGELVVIVNAANPVTSLSIQEVRSHFLKKAAAWKSGDKIRPVDCEEDIPERKGMVEKLLGLKPLELKRYWIERQYASAGQPAAGVPDEASVVKFVALFKGSIGFVTKTEFTKATGVKAVLTLTY